MLKKVTNLQGMLLLVLMFLVSMEFFSLHHYIIFAAFFLLLIGRRRIWVDGAGFLYFIFCIVIGIHESFVSILSIIRPLSYTMCYLIGLNFVGTIPSEPIETVIPMEAIENKIIAAVKAVTYGMFFHYFLNFVYNSGKDFFRNSDDIWTGSTRSATGQALLAVMMAALCCCELVIGSRRRKIVAVIHLTLIMVYNVMLGGRTLVVLTLLLFVIGLLCYSHYLHRKIEILKPVLWILVIIGVFILLFIFNIFGMQEYILESSLIQRFTVRGEDLFEGGRLLNKWKYLTRFYLTPLGGKSVLREQYGYAHDLLLDSFDAYGILPFVLLIMILCYTVKRLKQILCMRCYSAEFKTVLIVYYAAFCASFLLEPILIGIPIVFVAFCFVNGLVSGLTKMNEQQMIIDFVEEEMLRESEST